MPLKVKQAAQEADSHPWTVIYWLIVASLDVQKMHTSKTEGMTRSHASVVLGYEADAADHIIRYLSRNATITEVHLVNYKITSISC